MTDDDFTSDELKPEVCDVCRQVAEETVKCAADGCETFMHPDCAGGACEYCGSTLPWCPVCAQRLMDAGEFKLCKGHFEEWVTA